MGRASRRRAAANRDGHMVVGAKARKWRRLLLLGLALAGLVSCHVAREAQPVLRGESEASFSGENARRRCLAVHYPPMWGESTEALGQPLLEGLFVPGFEKRTNLPGWEQLYFRFWADGTVLMAQTILVVGLDVDASQRLGKLEKRNKSELPCKALYEQGGYFWYERRLSESDVPKVREIVEKAPELCFRYARRQPCTDCPRLTLSASGDLLSLPSLFFSGPVSSDPLQWALEILELGSAGAEEEFFRSSKKPKWEDVRSAITGGCCRSVNLELVVALHTKQWPCCSALFWPATPTRGPSRILFRAR